ncbi:hypothetical protein ACFRCG_06560 [Embleya sp. NPDC056575]
MDVGGYHTDDLFALVAMLAWLGDQLALSHARIASSTSSQERP